MLLEASERLLKASAISETEPASRPAMPLARHSVMLRPMLEDLSNKAQELGDKAQQLGDTAQNLGDTAQNLGDMATNAWDALQNGISGAQGN